MLREHWIPWRKGNSSGTSWRYYPTGGIIPVESEVEKQGNRYEEGKAVLGRTARRLMDGYGYVPEKYFLRARVK
jgi:2-methylaconitate cis-trans-isomerase PrpF